MDSLAMLISSLTGLGDLGASYDIDWELGSIDDDISYRADNASKERDGDASDDDGEGNKMVMSEQLLDMQDEMFEIFEDLDESLLDGRLSDAVTDMIRERRAALKARSEALRAHLSSAKGVKLLDKLTFVISVVNVALTGFIAGAFPHYMPFWYTGKFVLLIGTRFFVYRRQKFHFFLADFCYAANMMLMLSLWAFPDNVTLFKICFSFAMGPLSWAILAWRNSLVFHSLDKVTSVFLHLGPAAVVHNLRWWAAEAAPDSGMYQLCREPGSCTITFFEASVWPLLPYLGWQVAYYLFVEVISAEKVKKRNYVTSFRHLVGETKNKDTLVYRLCDTFGERWHQPMFMLVQLAFTFITMLPVKLFFDYNLAHTLFYFFLFLVSVWNGAGFYFDVFARKYAANLPSSRNGTPKLRRSRASSRVTVPPTASSSESTEHAAKGKKDKKSD